MKKTMICMWNDADTGKSSSIVEAYNELVSKYGNIANVKIPGYNNPDTGQSEILAVLNYNGTKIGIESQGDPNGRQFDTLPELQKLGCDIIVCTSRTRGNTCGLVVNTSKTGGYDLIWTGNAYFSDAISSQSNPRQSNIHKYNGKVIVNLIDELIAGNI